MCVRVRTDSTRQNTRGERREREERDVRVRDDQAVEFYFGVEGVADHQILAIPYAGCDDVDCC